VCRLKALLSRLTLRAHVGRVLDGQDTVRIRVSLIQRQSSVGKTRKESDGGNRKTIDGIEQYVMPVRYKRADMDVILICYWDQLGIGNQYSLGPFRNDMPGLYIKFVGLSSPNGISDLRLNEVNVDVAKNLSLRRLVDQPRFRRLLL
jgi:hypothetical protein